MIDTLFKLNQPVLSNGLPLAKFGPTHQQILRLLVPTIIAIIHLRYHDTMLCDLLIYLKLKYGDACTFVKIIKFIEFN
jgi:hypothetical protein